MLRRNIKSMYRIEWDVDWKINIKSCLYQKNLLISTKAETNNIQKQTRKLGQEESWIWDRVVISMIYILICHKNTILTNPQMFKSQDCFEFFCIDLVKLCFSQFSLIKVRSWVLLLTENFNLVIYHLVFDCTVQDSRSILLREK